jgi:hypothetical protein
MFARYLLSICLLMFAKPAAALSPELNLEDLISPDEISEELNLGPTDYSPLIEPQTPAQVLEFEGLSVYDEFPVVIVISKGSQTGTAYVNGYMARRFLVSTGRERWETAKSGRTYFTTTPTGYFSPKRYIRDHYSTTWEAHMEYSIFFNGGIALHATTPDHYKQLGTRASGGCVRMHKRDAIWVWNVSQAHRSATVPYFTRSGTLLKNRDGSIKRHRGNGTLIIVTSY